MYRSKRIVIHLILRFFDTFLNYLNYLETKTIFDGGFGIMISVRLMSDLMFRFFFHSRRGSSIFLSTNIDNIIDDSISNVHTINSEPALLPVILNSVNVKRHWTSTVDSERRQKQRVNHFIYINLILYIVLLFTFRFSYTFLEVVAIFISWFDFITMCCFFVMVNCMIRLCLVEYLFWPQLSFGLRWTESFYFCRSW